MLARLLEIVERLVLGRPRLVLAGVAALTLLAAWQGAGIEVRTARRELVADNDLPQQRYDALTAELGEIQPLIIVLERTDPELDLGAVAVELAAALEETPEIERVAFRLDTGRLLRTAPWLADPTELTESVSRIEELLGTHPGALRIDGIAALDERLAERLEVSVAEGTTLPGEAGARQAERLADMVEAQARLLTEPETQLPDPMELLLAVSAERAGLSVLSNGVYADGSGDRAFLFALGAEPASGLESERSMVRAARERVVELTGRAPGLTGGLTGQPAMTVEEMDTIARDGRRTSAVALVGVVLLASAAFHWRRHALLGLLVLGAGVLWALAAVELQVGYLNMITTAMIPILIGIGIDYAVHPISQYEIERLTATDRLQAVRRTFRTTAGAVVVSALTTAAAFACFLFMEFRGFAELGQAASVGVLLCLAAALLVLPALLLLLGRAPEPGDEPKALVDRLWSRRVIDRLCRAPRAVVVAAAMVTAAAGWFAGDVALRSSLLELLPPTAESLHYLEQVESSSFGAWFNVVVTDDLDELRRLEERAGRHPEIRRFDSIARLLPEDLDASREAVARLRSLLDRLRIEGDASDDGRLHAALSRLEVALGEAADNAFMAGLGDVAGPLERARASAARAAASVAGGTTGAQRAREAELLERLRTARAGLLEAAGQGPPTIADLPAPVRSRFMTASGRYTGYLYAAGNIFEPEFLSRFNAASMEVSASAIGWPVLFEAHAAGITDGFRLALGAGALAVLLLLVVELRRLSFVLLALVPVLAGLTWMIGLMGLFGIDFNFANLVAIPLVLGVGIDAGVHVMHRYRLEGSGGVGIVMEHTGRAILIGSLTTMVGFGSLMLAHHRGMAGLGTLLFLGVGASLVAALVVLPSLLLLFRFADR